MSMPDSGQYGSYVPPPPPAARRSPWLYVALGCGLFILLGFGGCIAITGYFVNQVKSEMKKPLDSAAVMKGLGDTPIYPGAKLNEKGTKMSRSVLVAMRVFVPAVTSEIAAFDSPDSDDKIIAWYDEKMAQNGWERTKNRNENQHMFRKGTEMAAVQLPQTSSSPYAFVLMRFHGVKKGPRD